MAIDFVNRFTATPLEVCLTLSRATLVVTTNSQALVNRLRLIALPRHLCQDLEPACQWRIVVEASKKPVDGMLLTRPFSARHDQLAFVSLGPQSFLAYDQTLQRGVGFISEELVHDEQLFRAYFLPALNALLALETGQDGEPFAEAAS